MTVQNERKYMHDVYVQRIVFQEEARPVHFDER